MDKALIIGIDEIDRQHEALFENLDLLHDYVRRGESRNAIGNTLKFLESYVSEHFDNEVRYMKQYRYPDLLQHKAEHEIFLKDFTAFKEKYALLKAQGEMTTFLGLDIVRRLNAWLNNHVLTVDKKMGAFLKEQMDAK
jgi:hemerythrin